jgi:hypothetical protein
MVLETKKKFKKVEKKNQEYPTMTFERLYFFISQRAQWRH